MKRRPYALAAAFCMAAIACAAESAGDRGGVAPGSGGDSETMVPSRPTGAGGAVGSGGWSVVTGPEGMGAGGVKVMSSEDMRSPTTNGAGGSSLDGAAGQGGRDAAPIVIADAKAQGGDGAPVVGTNPLAGIGAVEMLQAFGGSTEGVLWIEAKKQVLVCERETSVCHLFDPIAKKATVFRSNTNQTVGNAIDNDGRLLSAEQGQGAAPRTARIVRSAGPGIDGAPATFMERFAGGLGAPAGRFNRPNDLVVRADGAIYFTDPFYAGAANIDLGNEFQGVYRASADGKTIVAEAWLKDKPNGIALTVDQKTVFVATRSPNVIHRFDAAADGSLAKPTRFATTPDYADGIAADDAGNLWAAVPGASGGIYVFRPNGELVGKVPGISAATNIAFGDSDRRTLYVASGATLKRVRVSIPGPP